MAEKPKNSRGKKRSKGFYTAVYASIAGLFVLAIAIGYATLISPNDSGFEISEAALPVGGTMDVPIANITPPTTPPRDLSDVRHHELDGGLHATQPTTEPEVQPITQPQVYIPPYYPLVYEPDMVEVLGPAFVYFTEADDMHWPILGNIVLDFSTGADSFRWNPTLEQWSLNESISIEASRGDAVRSAAAGIIESVEFDLQDGLVVVIDHGNGWNTTYRQLDPQSAVAVGDVVSRGQIIGTVGTPTIFTAEKGYHVNFHVQNGEGIVNPHEILTARAN
ncbi:MAG: M23 family metallopeptidase [Defluviitaleaceae bacterium]|nr:M23 family metallopeptidase [Defluviitaleaceae bacterium]